jgi:hypothetical protein
MAEAYNAVVGQLQQQKLSAAGAGIIALKSPRIAENSSDRCNVQRWRSWAQRARMFFTTCVAGSFSGTDFCLIFAPCEGYDEPEILPSSTTQSVS